MRRVRTWLSRLLATLDRRRRRDDDFAAEIESHLQLHIDDNLRAGMTPAEARRTALVRFGGTEATRELHRERRGLPRLEWLFQDLRYGFRTLKSPQSWSAIAMLAVAIGLATSMFAVVDAMLLRPVPFRDADRLVHLFMRNEHGGFRGVSREVLRAWRNSPVVETAEGVLMSTAVVAGQTEPLARPSAAITPGLLDMLGIRPVRGRVFTRDDTRAGGANTILISEEIWRTAFVADPAIVGRSVPFNRGTATIVGVLPAGFRFPEWNTEIWQAADESGGERLVAYVRWREGVPDAERLRVATTAAQQADPSLRGHWASPGRVAGFDLETYYKRALSVLSGGVALVFLALCANVASLLLGRFSARQREFLVCTALGASRMRLLSRALAESVGLVAVAVAVGIVVARLLVDTAGALLPEAFISQTLHPLRVEPRAILVAALSGASAVLLAGLLPAIVAARTAQAGLGRLERRTTTASRSARMLERSLLVGELAMACALLLGAALLVKSFVNLTRIDRGFQPAGLMTFDVWLGGPAYTRTDVRSLTFDNVEAAIRALPGVRQLGRSAGAPMSQSAETHSYGWLTDSPGAAPVHLILEVNRTSPEYFDLYGLRLLRGRTFRSGEDVQHVVIDERLARALWPHDDPIGRWFRGGGQQYQIIGIVRDVRSTVVETDREWPQMYVPFSGGRFMTIGIQCGDTCPSEALIRSRILAVGSGIDVRNVHRIEDAVAYDVAQPRATAALAFVFAVISIVAAAGGLFSVLSYAVTRRRREFGIRVALGGSAAAIRRLVFRDGLRTVAGGAALGLAAAWPMSKVLASLQQGIASPDWITWLVVFGALTAAGLLACWYPARAAMRVDPATLLREE